MNISISFYTARGKRPNNEDTVSVLESDAGSLAIVADGLGGHEDGEVASKQAVATLNKMLQSKIPDEDVLIDAIQQASRDVFEIRKSQRPMHTTIASLWLGDNWAVAANVGDSRIYQFRNDRIIYQSLDHSVAQMAVLVGELDKSEIRSSKDRNRLIRVLGDANVPKVDSEILHIQQGDRFLLCSDGFWESVTETVMLNSMVQTTTAQAWLATMRDVIEEADNRGQDNHTAIAIIVEKAKGGGKNGA